MGSTPQLLPSSCHSMCIIVSVDAICTGWYGNPQHKYILIAMLRPVALGTSSACVLERNTCAGWTPLSSWKA